MLDRILLTDSVLCDLCLVFSILERFFSSLDVVKGMADSPMRCNLGSG